MLLAGGELRVKDLFRFPNEHYGPRRKDDLTAVDMIFYGPATIRGFMFKDCRFLFTDPTGALAAHSPFTEDEPPGGSWFFSDCLFLRCAFINVRILGRDEHDEDSEDTEEAPQYLSRNEVPKPPSLPELIGWYRSPASALAETVWSTVLRPPRQGG